MFHNCLENLLRKQKAVTEDELFGNPDRLLDAVLAKFAAIKPFSKTVVGGQPAADILAERLRSLEPPELARSSYCCA